MERLHAGGVRDTVPGGRKDSEGPFHEAVPAAWETSAGVGRRRLRDTSQFVNPAPASQAWRQETGADEKECVWGGEKQPGSGRAPWSWVAFLPECTVSLPLPLTFGLDSGSPRKA